MTRIPWEFIGIVGLALIAFASALALSDALERREGYAPSWTIARRKAAGWHAFEAWIMAILSPIIAVVTLVFLATMVPAVLLLLPLFVVWAVQQHEANERHFARLRHS